MYHKRSTAFVLHIYKKKKQQHSYFYCEDNSAHCLLQCEKMQRAIKTEAKPLFHRLNEEIQKLEPKTPKEKERAIAPINKARKKKTIKKKNLFSFYSNNLWERR